jgi:hypothetical protein
MGERMYYKAVHNKIVDQAGKLIAEVSPINCSAKMARSMAAYCAQQMNHAERNKQRRASTPTGASHEQ